MASSGHRPRGSYVLLQMIDRTNGRGTVNCMSDVIPTQSASRDIPWDAGRWSNRPVSTRVSEDGTLYVMAAEGSDAWRHTSYGFVHDTEHALLVSFTPRTSMEVEFGTPFEEQFDQAGIFVRVSAEHWVKAGIEFTDGTPHIGAVVTDGRSDWSATPVPGWSGRPVTMRISWADDALTVRARCSEGPWKLVRVAPFDAWEGVTAGPFVCAPTRSGLEVPFCRWSVGEADRSLH